MSETAREYDVVQWVDIQVTLTLITPVCSVVCSNRRGDVRDVLQWPPGSGFDMRSAAESRSVACERKFNAAKSLICWMCDISHPIPTSLCLTAMTM